MGRLVHGWVVVRAYPVHRGWWCEKWVDGARTTRTTCGVFPARMAHTQGTWYGYVAARSPSIVQAPPQ